jgi:hypothetical protein
MKTLCLFLCALPALALAEEKAGTPRVAVLDVDVRGSELDPVVGESLSAVLAAEIALRGAGRYEVLSRSNVRTLLAQQIERQKMGGDTTESYAALGRAADAELIVISSVTKLGDELLLTLELADTTSGMVTNRQRATYRGPPAGLVELIRPYVARLLDGTAAEAYRGQLEILSTEPNAVVVLGDRNIGNTPVQPVTDLPIGRHRVQISKDGFVPYQADIVVNREETTVLQASLVDEASLAPWYTKWWVWTAVVAAVVGGTTAAVLLSEDDPAPPELVVDQQLP